MKVPRKMIEPYQSMDEEEIEAECAKFLETDCPLPKERRCKPCEYYDTDDGACKIWCRKVFGMIYG